MFIYRGHGGTWVLLWIGQDPTFSQLRTTSNELSLAQPYLMLTSSISGLKLKPSMSCLAKGRFLGRLLDFSVCCVDYASCALPLWLIEHGEHLRIRLEGL